MTALLDGITSPEELKKMPDADLERLCGEIRETLINTAHENGGHLASNLGAVELTVALHRVFDSPRDTILWDVGHQCYTHKLLTGRKKRFSTIRQYGGLSGFPDPLESLHDPLYSGHAGTSISSAVGIALAGTLKKKPGHAIAVIGDGSLGSGMALEAINHAGHGGMNVTIILNDNGMSISPTVGSLCRALQRVRLDRRYQSARENFARNILRMPLGENLLTMALRLKRLFKNTMLPGTLWEELGLHYIGPVDGHDLSGLQEIFRARRDAGTGPQSFMSLPAKARDITRPKATRSSSTA
jgi:1-deoxy-D-xylulose-5-phosphate synthase